MPPVHCIRDNFLTSPAVVHFVLDKSGLVARTLPANMPRHAAEQPEKQQS